MIRLPHTDVALALAKSGMTQKQAAQEMGVSPAYLSDVCRGKRKISIAFAQVAEDILKVDGYALLERQLQAEWSGEI